MKSKQCHLVCVTVCLFAALFSAAGCKTMPLMVSTPKLKARDMDHAVVTFVRSSVMSPTQDAEIWDRETPVGELSTRSYIQYKAKPGKHLFLAKSEQSDKWSYVDATLITGEHYVIKVEVTPGGYAARFVMRALSPKNGDVTKADIDDWLNSLKGKKIIEEMIPGYVEKRGLQAKKAVEAYENGRMIPEILYPEDFWPDSI